MLPEFALNSILVIVTALFPGLVFRLFYYASQFAKQFTKGEWSERIAISIFWGIVAQLITLLFFSYFPWVDSLFNKKDILNIDVKNLFTFLSKNREYIVLFLAYIIFSVIISGLIGYLGYKLIRSLKLDLRSPIWRYSNVWHYYFSGELKPKGKLLFTWVDLVIRTEDNGNKNKMVQGALVDYTTDSSTGDLEYIFLEKSRRYSETSKDFKTIPGDVFVIPFKNVLDMNIRLEYKSEQNTLKDDWYSKLFTILVLLGLILYLILPWRLAMEELSIWNIIISYFPALICYISTMGLFSPIKSQSNLSKGNIIFSRFILLFIAFIAFLVTKWVLGWGFWFENYDFIFNLFS